MLKTCHDAIEFAMRGGAYLQLHVKEQHRITGGLLELKELLGLNKESGAQAGPVVQSQPAGA